MFCLGFNDDLYTVALGNWSNKFNRRGPTLSGVGSYRRHHLSHEHYQQTVLLAIKFELTHKYSSSKYQNCSDKQNGEV